MEQETLQNINVNLETGIEPQWKSDSDAIEVGQQMATHQLITLSALNAFIADYGFYNTDGTTALIIALNLSAASGLPDIWETNGGNFFGTFL